MNLQENFDQSWNERKAIHFRMQNLEGEMKDIREEYGQLFNRLRELDSSESLHSSEHLTAVTAESVDTSSESIPSNSNPSETTEGSPNKEVLVTSFTHGEKEKLDAIFDALFHENGLKKDIQVTSTKTEKSEKESLKNQSIKPRKFHTKRAELQAKKKATLALLRKKSPLKAKEIKAELLEERLIIGNITSFLTNLVDEYEEIQRVDRGLYAWIEIEADLDATKIEDEEKTTSDDILNQENSELKSTESR